MAATVKLPILITGKDQSSRAFRQVQGNLKLTQNAIGGVTRLLAPLAAAFSVGALGSNLIRTNKEFQSLQASLITFTGSVDQAKTTFDILKDFAKTTPFALSDVVNSFNVLVSRGIRPTLDQLEAFSDVAGGTGKAFSQFAEAVADAATGEFERLKEFGIKASKEKDKLTFTFDDLTLTVNNSSDEILEALNEIATKKFAGGAARQAATLGGAFTNLGDATDDLLFSIGEAGLSKELIRVAKRITGLTSDGGKFAKVISGVMVRAIRGLERSFEFLAENIDEIIAGLKIAFGIVIVRKIAATAQAIVSFTRAIVTTVAASKVFSLLFSKKGAMVIGLGATAAAATGVKLALEGQIEETINAIKSNEILKTVLEGAEKITNVFTDALGLNADVVGQVTEKYEENTKETKKLNATVDTAAKQLDLFTQKFTKQNSEIFTNRTAMSDLEKQLQDITKAHSLGIISSDEFAEAQKNVKHEIIDLRAEQDKTFGSGAIKGIKDYYNSISDNAVNASAFVGDAFKSLESGLSEFFQSGKLDFKSFTDVIKKGLADLAAKAVISTGLNFLGKVFPSLAFAEGGFVSGPGGPTSDSVLARLSAGEYVVKSSAVNKLGIPALEQINQGRLPMGAVDDEVPGFFFGGIIKKIKKIVKKIVKTVKDVVKGVTDAVKAVVGAISSTVSNIVKGIVSGDMSTLLPLITSFVLPGIGTAIAGNLMAGSGFAASIAGGISSSFASGILGAGSLSSIATSVGIEMMKGTITNGLSGAISNKFLGVKDNMTSAGSGFDVSRSNAFGKLFNSSKPFMAAQTGGAFDSGQAIRVGEQGPEVFMSQRNGSVLPIKSSGSELVEAIYEVKSELVDLRRQFARALAGGTLAGARA